MNEVDTREKLYADIDHWLGSWTALSVRTSTIKEAVLGWLDRQAAIDHKEFQMILEEIQGCMRNGSR